MMNDYDLAIKKLEICEYPEDIRKSFFLISNIFFKICLI
jgi:hypothetical protein